MRLCSGSLLQWCISASAQWCIGAVVNAGSLDSDLCDLHLFRVADILLTVPEWLRDSFLWLLSGLCIFLELVVVHFDFFLVLVHDNDNEQNRYGDNGCEDQQNSPNFSQVIAIYQHFHHAKINLLLVFAVGVYALFLVARAQIAHQSDVELQLIRLGYQISPDAETGRCLNQVYHHKL